MSHFEEKQSSQEVFSGRVFQVTVDQVRLENGKNLPKRGGTPPRWGLHCCPYC